MKILFLGYDKTKTSLIDFLINRGHFVTCVSKKILDFSAFDMVISFGYSHIIKNAELLTLKRPIINLHISFLPYNRGAHPNFWAHYENTPSGVSIHEIDLGVDTGPILFQKEMNFKSHEKLESSYSKLRIAIESLFIENILSIESMSYEKSYPKHIGTFHKLSDLPPWVNWDMSIKEVHEKTNNNECYAVLGHLMDAEGVLGEESKLRVLKLIELVKNKSNQIIFFCGWDYRDDSSIKIASALSIFFKNNCSNKHNIYLSDLSRDTVGDAIFLRKLFYSKIGTRKINVITSNYHCHRSNMIFNYVFADNKIELHEAIIKNSASRVAHEKKSYQAFLQTFESIESGDIETIYQTLISNHPYYNGDVYKKIESK